MSRVGKKPVNVPAGVSVNIEGRKVFVKGPKGETALELHSDVQVSLANKELTFAPVNEKSSWAQVGTARALVANLLEGVSKGFEKKLQLVGVGYRAQVAGKKVSLSVGYSHPVEYELPTEITAECPTQTEIVLKSWNLQGLGQAAANIRAFRKPEPYKGKGIRHANENVKRKEAKKK
ncbi:MAG: 50S ribosomal protein L6 [Pseudomonadota bacterium]